MARLDHPGVIRSYATWIERPPEGWQYEADARILERIRSSNRALLNFKSDSAFIYVQMQLCDFSLASWLSENTTRESRNVTRIKSWFKQMVEAVEFLHRKKLIHRNLKPSNILFIEDDRLKISGLQNSIEMCYEEGVEISGEHDGTGVEMYMSPEQINRRDDFFGIPPFIIYKLESEFPKNDQLLLLYLCF
ncbi:hypothetical protein PENTCL1PPCAC_8548 [Pristionchus entomophagus]|uniref:Protein kinase domain-containing protein n=1 Tax=Pristionchus entomophagus TaxID=358040 RepID=A0AAV5STA4_9BILA|nr:hypothetical protein PENTCL1PPCAC_8548 [Pristionchus entomophagus]